LPAILRRLPGLLGDPGFQALAVTLAQQGTGLLLVHGPVTQNAAAMAAKDRKRHAHKAWSEILFRNIKASVMRPAAKTSAA
jgi:hypothetical protein